MNKRGLSTIIVSLILIVISLAAIGIFWLVINNIVKSGSEQVGLERFMIDGEIKNVAIYNDSNNISLTFKRKAGLGEMTGIKFVFAGETNTEVATEKFSIKELEEKNFDFHLFNLTMDELSTITIYPLLLKEDKDEIIGNSLGVFDVKHCGCWHHHPGSCTPTTCSALGYECGSHANGTCAGTLNCGTCSSGYSCVSGHCQSTSPEAPLDTTKYYLRDSSNNPVAWFGNLGNIVLKGRCFSGTNCNSPGANSFIIGNSSDGYTAFVNASGDLCIEKGDCSDDSSSCNSLRNAFLIKDTTNQNVAYIDYDGDLCLTGNLYENSAYV